MPEIPDDVTRSETARRGAPSDALAWTLANAAGLAAENATIIQQQDNVTAQAATAAAVERLLGAEVKR